MTEGAEPAFGGKCALGVGLGAGDRAPAGKAKYAVEKDGKTYLFSGPIPKLIGQTFPGLLKRAERKAAA